MKSVKTILAIGVVLLVSACEKCQECHYEGVAGEVEIGEFCGDDLKNPEDNGFTVGDTVYTAHCEEH